MKRLLWWTVAALAVGATAGCKPKQLSKEEAQKLVDGVGVRAEQCRFEVEQGKNITDPSPSFYIAGSRDRAAELAACATAIEKSGLATIEKPCRPFEGEAGAAREMCNFKAVTGQMKAGEYKVFQDVDCATATAQVTSITTEGNKATVKYVVTSTVRPALAAAAFPKGCATVSTPPASAERTLAATRDDDGRWSVQK